MELEAPVADIPSTPANTMTEDTANICFTTEGPYASFSNSAPYSVQLDGKEWPTTEHYFQVLITPSKSAETRYLLF